MDIKGDILCREDILKELRYKEYDPVVYDVTDSTNLVLKRWVKGGRIDNKLVVADRQTMGRGRLGRTFESPPVSGIYMSLLIPAGDDEGILLITSAAAVAVCRAIKEVCHIDTSIKWVNDIYLNDRKVCGILAEAVTAGEGEINVILGIGINVATESSIFSDTVRDVAGALYDTMPGNITRNSLIAAVVNNFMDIYGHITDREYLGDYRRMSMILGRDIRYLKEDAWHTGKAVDIDNDGGLVVKTKDDIITLNTGEISVRLEK